MDFWYPDDDAPIDPNWWAPLMRFGLAAARDGLPAFSPALQHDRSNEVFEEPPADESGWPSDDLSAA